MSYSLDCYLVTLTVINLMYFKVIWVIIMPFIYFITLFIFYIVLIISKISKFKSTVISTTLIYLFMYMQPNLVGEFISLISSRKIGGETWV